MCEQVEPNGCGAIDQIKLDYSERLGVLNGPLSLYIDTFLPNIRFDVHQTIFQTSQISKNTCASKRGGGGRPLRSNYVYKRSGSTR